MQNAKAVIFEAALVAAIGLAFALAANALSPRGLRLNRDHFPRGEMSSAPTVVPANPTNIADSDQTLNFSQNSGGTSYTSPQPFKIAEQSGTRVTHSSEYKVLAQPLSPQGLQLVASNQVVELFRDARYEQGLVVFVDARSDALYEAGHIPGAWQFDHYHAERYLPTVLPPCLNAQQVVVYCIGATCEDSEFAAIMLRDAGVPREKLFVYTNGITEWMASGLPVETGARRSGQLLKPQP